MILDKQNAELLLYALSILLPNAIAILTLAKKAYFKNGIKQIKGELFSYQLKNQNDHKKIFDNLNECHKIMIDQQKSLKDLLKQKDIAFRIREITKHAIDYCRNRKIGKILNIASQQLIKFCQQVLDIGIENITKEQLIAKYWSMVDNVDDISKNILGQKLWDEWKNNVKNLLKKYLKCYTEIQTDIMNSKEQRFIIKSEDLAQTIIKQFINFTAKHSEEINNEDNDLQ